MNDRFIFGIVRFMIPLPRVVWQRAVAHETHDAPARTAFMTTEHHLVRDFVVREIPRVGKPLSPEFIAQSLSLPLAQVNPILDELEAHLTFLFRNARGEVHWAYPVTVDDTPHRVTFSTGEQVNAA